MLSVWLHDIQRVRSIDGDHAKIGAIEAEKVLKQFQYPQETIDHVRDIILAHRCRGNLKPKTIEGKILVSADAMSHYINDFYLTIAVTGQRSVSEFKKWALEKLERDYNHKIFFDFAREMIQERHDISKKFFRGM